MPVLHGGIGIFENNDNQCTFEMIRKPVWNYGIKLNVSLERGNVHTVQQTKQSIIVLSVTTKVALNAA